MARVEVVDLERRARTAVETRQLEGHRAAATIRLGFSAAGREVAMLQRPAADVRAERLRAAREALNPFDPMGRNLL